MTSTDELQTRVRSLHAERARPDAKPPTVEDLMQELIGVLAVALADDQHTRRRRTA